MRMKAAVLREIDGPVAVEEIKLAPPNKNEVLVKTAYTGFCHSDLSMIKGILRCLCPRDGTRGAGIVEDVGPGVTSVEKGDHVVATWMIACGQCPECRKGLRHICRTSFVPHGVGGLLDMTSRLTDRHATVEPPDKRFRFRRIYGRPRSSDNQDQKGPAS